MATKRFLAVDIGAESGRTVLARFDGRRIELEETHRFANEPVWILDHLHWDILRLWHEVQNGIARSMVVAVGADGPDALAGLGIDTWGVDFGLIGTDGGLVGNPFHYRDSRTDGIFDAAFRVVPRADIYRVTGLQFLKFNTLFQLLAAKRTVPGDPFASAHRLLFIPDLLNYLITGVAAAEYTIASTSQLLDAKQRQWSRELLERFALPARLLPELIEPGTILGPARTRVAKVTGMGKTPVLASAGHDTAAAVVGVPATAQRHAYISSGTWSLMGAELASPVITERSLADNFTNEGGVGGTIRFLKNIMGLWLVQECRRGLARRGTQLDYGALTSMAAASPPFVTLLNPDEPAFLNPPDMPSAIAENCRARGEPVPEGPGALVRTCLESLALCYRRTLARLEANVGHRIEVIHVVGGGSRNELLCQLTADCCGRPVIAGPVEATALGNCLIQMMGVGEIAGLAQAREIVRQSFETRLYEPVTDSRWDDQFARFETLLDQG